MEIFNIMLNVFTFTFDQFRKSLQNKSPNLKYIFINKNLSRKPLHKLGTMLMYYKHHTVIMYDNRPNIV